MLFVFYLLLEGANLSEDEGDSSSSSEEVLADCEEVFTVKVPMHEIKAGNFRLVYAHPEAFLSAPQGKSMLRSKIYRDRICCVAIDEAHMIYEWQVFVLQKSVNLHHFNSVCWLIPEIHNSTYQ